MTWKELAMHILTLPEEEQSKELIAYQEEDGVFFKAAEVDLAFAEDFRTLEDGQPYIKVRID